MLKRLIPAVVLFARIGTSDAGGGVLDFQRISDQGPTDDSTCQQYGGVSVPVTDDVTKTIVRNGRNQDRRIYYNGYVYVMYGSPSGSLTSLMAPTYSMNLCRFLE